MEHTTMINSRQLSSELGLNMKIGDVEYQGDKTKAIFYYIADDRVDFRQLIKVLAEKFKVRIEMRQIGARQEAGRIGGIGSCGRELCCGSWITNFVSVTTNSARYQEISLNPQKLAGQCGKLKCCLNYELDAYLDEQKDFPNTSVVLKTKNGKATHQKTDVFKRLMWYSYEEEDKRTLTCMTVDTIKEIIDLNKKGTFPEKLTGVEESEIASVVDYQNAVGEESLTRFENKPSSKNKKHHGKRPFKKGVKKAFKKNNQNNNNPPNSNIN
jgi:cell fate regulator YaaT (PSP1 superfamily)